MQVDWVTVAAQIVNFLVLVWLLKRFLYRPITEAIAAREARIAARVTEAAQARDEAELRAAAYDEKVADLEQRKEESLAQARAEARKTRQALEQAARQEVEALGQEWRKRLEAEQARYLADLRDRAALSIVNLSRKALTDLADETLEVQIARRFEDRIREFAQPLRDALRAHSGDRPAGRITTRFQLPEQQRNAIRRALSEAAGTDLDIAFEEGADEPPGVVLTIAGLRIAWTIDSYLDALEADVGGYLKNQLNARHAEQ